jgi:hypothetical protein
VEDALVEGDHVPAEAAVLLVAADQPLLGALQDADDARSTRATTRSPWRASFMLTAET